MTSGNVHSAFGPQMSALSKELAWFFLIFFFKVAVHLALTIHWSLNDKALDL